MKLSIIFTICLLACTVSMGSIVVELPSGLAQTEPPLGLTQEDIAVERSLPPMTPSQCSAPAQIQGQVAVDDVIARINEAGHTFRNVQGGCGRIILTKEQQDNFPAFLLADVRLDQPGIKCDTLNSSNVNEPFGLATEVKCSKTIKPTEGEPLIVYLVVGVMTDIDGETIVYFVTASE